MTSTRKKDPLRWRLRVQEEAPGCQCWDCLRRRGITPPKNSKPRFRKDVNGVSYSTASGKPKQDFVQPTPPPTPEQT